MRTVVTQNVIRRFLATKFPFSLILFGQKSLSILERYVPWLYLRLRTPWTYYPASCPRSPRYPARKKKDEKIIPRNCERFVYLIINCPSNYLETATSTILHDDTYVRWIGTGSDESVQIIVSQVSHLEKRSLICTWIGILGFDVLEATG